MGRVALRAAFIVLLLIVAGVGVGSYLINRNSNSPASPSVLSATTSNNGLVLSGGNFKIAPQPTTDFTPTDIPLPTLPPVSPTITQVPTPTALPANAPDASHSSILSDVGNTLSSGAQATLTVTIRNRYSVPISGIKVTLSTPDSLASFTNNGSITDAGGQVKVQISSSSSLVDPISAAVSGNNLNVTLPNLITITFQSHPSDTPIPSPTPVSTPTPKP